MSILDQLDEKYLVQHDFDLSYVIGEGSIAGRFVRLGPELNEILNRQNLPEPAALLLAEYLTAAAAMASSLKFDGILTFQTNSNGPISGLVADVTTTGHIRANCSYSPERLGYLGKKPSFSGLVGKGYIAITIDQGPDMERYQGIVDLVGTQFSDTLEHYFKQSNQQDMVIKLASRSTDEGYESAAITAQRVAFEGGTEIDEEEVKEAWRRAVILLSTATNEEMLDPALQPAELLYRLFNEDGVRLIEPKALKFQCRCSSDRVLNVLSTLSSEERRDCVKDGVIESVCEFCKTAYRFRLSEDDQIMIA